MAPATASGDIASAVARQEMRAEFERRMVAVEAASPQALAATIVHELALWSALIDEYKLSAD